MNAFWSKLSPRERNLAVATVSVILVALSLLIAVRAYGRIHQLGLTIDQLERDLEKYVELDARGVSVERAFVDVAAEHSSAWSHSTIHNRLRTEIYNLAKDENGEGNLIEIPRLRQGALKEYDGYREYKLNIRIPETDIYSLIIFLSRLQQSNQSLRIDGLEVNRAPSSVLANARIDVTRTVVDGAPENDTMVYVPPEDLQVATWDGSRLGAWKGTGCGLMLSKHVLGVFAADGGMCLAASATQPDASVAMTHELEPGSRYELILDAACDEPAVLHVGDAANNALLEGAVELQSDGRMHRYTVQFTVPATAPATTAAPYIVLSKAGTSVYLDNLDLKKLPE
ncbi:MAG: hypothetical protein GWP08_16595 [Nitrospiraceae bacterium]|nr:hypothetical protein [Nitrospiraceae bacterium]